MYLPTTASVIAVEAWMTRPKWSSAILAALELENVSVELFHTELGPSQQELSIRHSNVLRAADNVCLVRETVRGVARAFDLLASFAPKPFLDQAGSGAHIHLSLWGAENSKNPAKNLFYDASQRGGLSQPRETLYRWSFASRSRTAGNYLW